MPGIGNLIDSVINVLAILFRTPCMIDFVLKIFRENVDKYILNTDYCISSNCCLGYIISTKILIPI